MSQAQKYNFDVVFDEEGAVVSTPTERRKYSAEEVEAIKTQAYEDGESSEMARAANLTERTISQLASTVQQALQSLDQDAFRAKQQAFQLAITSAGKLAQHALRQYPFTEIEPLIEECLANAPTQSRIMITAPEEVRSVLEERIQDLAQTYQIEGRICIQVDPNMPPGDCKIEWDEGGVARSLDEIEQMIADIVSRRLTAEQAQFEQLDLFDQNLTSSNDDDASGV